MGTPAIVDTIDSFVQQVRKDYRDWKTETFPWFRGEPPSKTSLLPKLFRPEDDGRRHHENRLVQWFRARAPILGGRTCPPREDTVTWLFLMQHVDLPTRLLDWTQGSLIALYFALTAQVRCEEETGYRVVWMLQPERLNDLAVIVECYHQLSIELGPDQLHRIPAFLNYFSEHRMVPHPDTFQPMTEPEPPLEPNEFLIPWHVRKESVQMGEGGPYIEAISHKRNLGNVNFQRAWGDRKLGSILPVAIYPTNIHSRMAVQRSCFTIHGKGKHDREEINLCDFPEVQAADILKEYRILGNQKARKDMLSELRMLGISHATLFPDLDGLAKELETLF